MNTKQEKRISKFLSLILRHRPEKINIQLDNFGWANVNELVEKCNTFGVKFTKEELDYVVENNSKKRLAYSDDGLQIRASQGHSIKIDLGYKAIVPPEFLFHGTATRFLESIQKTGLDKRNRHHVHLSSNEETATSVGRRHGKLALLIVKSKEMHEAGHEFFVSENQVWLTDKVPLEFIKFP
jgi:putative RNA 2'-phosphotransferase